MSSCARAREVARLHSRIYVHFLGVLVVVAVTTAVVFALGTRDSFRREVAGRIAQHLASLAGERIADPDALTDRLRQIREDLRLDVRVRDLGGRTVAAVGDAVPQLTPTEEADVRAGRIVVHGRHPGFAAAPVRDRSSGAVVGFIEGVARHHHGPPTLWHPFLLVALALVVVAVATRPLAHRISRPLERLTAAARRLGGGDLSVRVPAAVVRGARADEIMELTRAFNEMAERIERLVYAEKELLANVSHELRSPLARIRVALELLPRTGDADRRLRDVERDLAELDRLIDDVLTSARLEARSLPTHLTALDARALLAEVGERARHDPLTMASEVRVEEGSPLSLTADPALLRRAVWNLVENAAKYGAPPVTLSCARAGDRVVLAVSDMGEGIAAADREEVFRPFYRGSAADRDETGGDARRGVGLGLTLARRIAEAHGGTIAIESVEDVNGRPRGCRVLLSLPAVPGGGVAATPASPR
jgi:two-component system OmpR family sensor kinase